MKKFYFAIFILAALMLAISCSKPNEIGNSKVIGSNAALLETFGLGKGQIPPDFTMATIEGKHAKLSEFKGKKPVILYFWATWCPSCKEDLTAVKNIYPKYSDKVEYLAMDLDTTEDTEMIREYTKVMGLEGNGMSFGAGDAKVLSDYKITTTTTKYAIGKDGKILYKGSGAFDEKQWEILFNAMASSN